MSVRVIGPEAYAAHPFVRLLAAVDARSAGAVASLLESVPSLDAPDPADGLPPLTPPLVLAASAGDASIVRQLLGRGASATVTDVRGYATPVLWAASAGALDALQALATHSDALLTALTSPEGETALHLAAGAHRALAPPTVAFLLDRHPAAVRAACARGSTPLHRAAAAGAAPEVAALLLAAGASPGAADAHGDTPVHAAARSGSADFVAALLDAGAPVDALNVERASPLHIASFWGHDAVVAALLAAGADASRRAAGDRLALHLAAAGDHAACVTLLLSVSDAAATDAEGATPEAAARAAGAEDALRALLEAAME